METTENEKNVFGELAPELKIVVLSHTDMETALAARQVSKEMRELADASSVWLSIASKYLTEKEYNTLSSDNLGGVKSRFFALLKLRRGKERWQEYNKITNQEGAPSIENPLEVLKRSIRDLNFAAIHGHLEAASLLRQTYDSFSLKNDEEIGDLELWQIPPTLDLDIYPVISADELLQLPDSDFYHIFSKLFFGIFRGPKTLSSRYCHILRDKGHPILASFIATANDITATALSEDSLNHHFQALTQRVLSQLSDEGFREKVNVGINTSLTNKDFEQLDLWLSYKLLKPLLEMEVNESFYIDLELINPDTYRPSNLTLRDFYSLPITAEFFFNLIEKVIDLSYENPTPREARDTEASERDKKQATLRNLGLNYYLSALNIGMSNNINLLECTPDLRRQEEGEALLANNFTWYLGILKFHIHLAYPSLFFVGSEIGGKQASFYYVYFDSINPFGRQIIKKAQNLIEAGHQGSIPVNLLAYLSLDSWRADCFYIKQPVVVAHKLKEMRDLDRLRNNLELEDDLLMSHGIMVLLFKGEQRESALEELQSAHVKFFRDNIEGIPSYQLRLLWSTILEISLNYRVLDVVRALIDDPRIVGYVDERGAEAAFRQRYNHLLAELETNQ
ncbi:hypothetical protein [Candidatus Odyssella thessalonicensis]|uniref:hypothetical protein n=1 Tax=Candidatus Odyssella thessalonicensis TaxID=84647 RepID=UPI000225AC32|nr:hypothetical protein [Candidatus Odyssella thessalonicensis]